jgi:pentatricopeptide repeat domain-containing protein 1
MNVAIKCGQLQKALEVYGELLREGCVPNVVTYNTLIDVHGKTGQWAEALKVRAAEQSQLYVHDLQVVLEMCWGMG